MNFNSETLGHYIYRHIYDWSLQGVRKYIQSEINIPIDANEVIY